MNREAVSVLRPGASPGEDEYGNPIPGPILEFAVSGCLVAPASSTVPVEVGRAAVITQMTVYMPAGTDVRALDGLRIRGDAGWLVDGDPAVWLGRGVVVSARRKEG